MTFALVLPLAVSPWKRPAHSGGHCWNPNEKHQRGLGYAVLSEMARNKLRRFAGPCRLSVVFSGPEVMRADTDNLTKQLLDACNQVLWEDDRQVVEINARKMAGEPFTAIKLEILESQTDPKEAA